MSQEKCWLQSNWKPILEIFTGVGFVFLLTIVTSFYTLIILNKDALKALIEAEATIFGFLGLIVVYILKSLDDREDRYLQRHFDIVIQKSDLALPDLGKQLERIRLQRSRTVRYALIVGIFLVSSILLSIFTLGMMDIAIEIGFTNIFGMIIIFLGEMGIFLFFYGVVELFRMFREMARMP